MFLFSLTFYLVCDTYHLYGLDRILPNEGNTLNTLVRSVQEGKNLKSLWSTLESSPSSVWREHTHEEDAKPMGNDSPFTASATTTHPKEVQESAQGHNLSEYEKSRVSGPNLMCCSGA